MNHKLKLSVPSLEIMPADAVLLALKSSGQFDLELIEDAARLNPHVIKLQQAPVLGQKISEQTGNALVSTINAVLQRAYAAAQREHQGRS